LRKCNSESGLSGSFSFCENLNKSLPFLGATRVSRITGLELDSSHGARMLTALLPDRSIRLASKENQKIPRCHP